MDYITSRSFAIPESAEELNDHLWFNMWSVRLWPYRELLSGDTLYWYESPNKRIVWVSRVFEVYRFTYDSKDEAGNRIQSRFGPFDRRQTYYINAPERGYCLAWKVKGLQRLDLPKPDDVRFPRQGWLRVETKIVRDWLAPLEPTDIVTLDDVTADAGEIIERLRAANEAMADVTPERVRSVISETLRKDTRLVNALKELCDFRCQFPGCGVRIPKRDGSFYIEVAHIHCISKGGKSVIGNLLVLCPNHHKEFDYGNLQIAEQTLERLAGELNGKDFEMELPGASVIV